MTTKRRPYTRPIESGWWRALPFYRFYMLRESTAIPALWFSLELIFGLFALKHGEESWAGFVQFLQHPVVLVLNLLALLGALLHSKTWFDLAPKASIVIIKGQKMPPEPLIKGLWAMMIVLSVAIFAVVMWA